MNTGIILAAGNSSRFGENKLFHLLNGKELVRHSIDVMSKVLDNIIVVTNSTCFSKIEEFAKPNRNVVVFKNDIDCRIESIRVGLMYSANSRNVVIHDAARPYITGGSIQTLLSFSETFLCSQFYFKLTNGLVRCGERLEVVPREKHIELVTPQIIDYRLAFDLYKNHINTEDCEVLPILDRLKIRYNLIEGHPRFQRKITTIEDIY